MATQASAITFIGTTGQSYGHGMKFIQVYLPQPLVMVVLCVLFVPFFYRRRNLHRVRVPGAALRRPDPFPDQLPVPGLPGAGRRNRPLCSRSGALGPDGLGRTGHGADHGGRDHSLHRGRGGSRRSSGPTCCRCCSCSAASGRPSGPSSASCLRRWASPTSSTSAASRGDVEERGSVAGSTGDVYALVRAGGGASSWPSPTSGATRARSNVYLTARSLAQSRLALPLQRFPQGAHAVLHPGHRSCCSSSSYHFEQPPLIFNPAEEAQVRQSRQGPAYEAVGARLPGICTRSGGRRRWTCSASAARGEIRTLPVPGSGGTTARWRTCAAAPRETGGDGPGPVVHRRQLCLPLLSGSLRAGRDPGPDDRRHLRRRHVVSGLGADGALQRHGHGLLSPVPGPRSLRPALSLGGLVSAPWPGECWRRGWRSTWASRRRPLLELVNQVGSYFYGSLLGVFLLAFLAPWATARGAFWGLILGMLSVWAVSEFTSLSFLYYNVVGCLSVMAAAFVLRRRWSPP